MSRRCDICSKRPRIGMSRSHSNIATKKKQYPNLQIKTVQGMKLRLCSKCLKAMKKS
ncbi:MAG: 50S ribosomal protein L28 [bacterium]